jgi:hypothetical protein
MSVRAPRFSRIFYRYRGYSPITACRGEANSRSPGSYGVDIEPVVDQQHDNFAFFLELAACSAVPPKESLSSGSTGLSGSFFTSSTSPSYAALWRRVVTEQPPPSTQRREKSRDRESVGNRPRYAVFLSEHMLFPPVLQILPSDANTTFRLSAGNETTRARECAPGQSAGFRNGMRPKNAY